MAAVAGLYGLGDEQRARHRRGQANAERSESRDDNTEAWVPPLAKRHVPAGCLQAVVEAIPGCGSQSVCYKMFKIL